MIHPTTPLLVILIPNNFNRSYSDAAYLGRNRSDYTINSQEKSSEFLILCHIRCKVEKEKSS